MNASTLAEAYSKGDRNFEGVQFCGENLGWSSLSGSNFRKADFYGTNLSGANLKNTDLSQGTNLSFADLSRADLTEADLRGANLEGANLEGCILNDTLYDEHTIFPKGFDPVKAGAIQFSIEIFENSLVEELQSNEPLESKLKANELHVYSDEELKSVPNEKSTDTVQTINQLSRNDNSVLTYSQKKDYSTIKLLLSGIAVGFFLCIVGVLAAQHQNQSTVLSTPSETNASVSLPKSNNPSLSSIKGVETLEEQKPPVSFSNKSTNQSSAPAESLEISEAKQVIEIWLSAKSKIFAFPYDKQLLAKVTTGKLYSDILEGSDLKWLTETHSSYEYPLQRVSDPNKVNIVNSNKVQVEAIVNERRILYSEDRKIDYSRSTEDISQTLFTLVKDDGVWKVEDYETVK
jgi:ARC6-like, IMS domain/Pentapeptide repeats (8 copies)